MAVSTKRFALTSAAYQDISEGYTECSFRMLQLGQRSNNIRIVLGTVLPDVNSVDYQIFRAPETRNDEEDPNFTDLATGDRVYARADGLDVSLVAFRYAAGSVVPAPAPVGLVSILDYGAIPSGAPDTEAANNAAFTAALAAARLQQQTHSTYGCSCIYVPPGAYRINETIELIETDDRISIIGAGKTASTLLMSVSDRDIIRFDGGISSTGIYENMVTDLKLAHTGADWDISDPDPLARPAYIRLKNCLNTDIKNVLFDGCYNGVVANRAARLNINDLMIFFRSEIGEPEPYAGIVFTADATMPGGCSRIFMDNIDITTRGALTPAATYGILVECADGLQITNGHCNHPRIGMAFWPVGDVNRDTVGGVHVSNFYFDTVTENNVVFDGTATSYGRIFFDSCRFRDAGVDAIRINPDAGTTIDVLQITGGEIDAATRKGLYCLNDGIESLIIEGTEFKDNNVGNTSDGGDMLLRGSNVSIEAKVKGGGAAGTAVRLDTDLTSGVVEVDTLGSTAGTRFDDNSTSVSRKPTRIECEDYAPTLTPVSNIDAVTLLAARYNRMERIVSLSGSASVDPTAAGAATFRMTVPSGLGSDFSSTSHASGILVSTTEFGRAEAEIATDQILFTFVAVTTTAHTMAFNASYEIL